MKARDLIPGWPCPRTTLPAIDPVHSYAYWCQLFTDAGKPVNLLEELEAERLASLAYHRQQQEMVDRWHRDRFTSRMYTLFPKFYADDPLFQRWSARFRLVNEP